MAPSADQEFVARQIVGSREEPTTILPVNGHIIIKLSPNDLSLYLQVNASLNPHKENCIFS